MSIVFCDVGVSADGFSAGPNQSLDNPLGVGGERVFRWRFEAPDEHKEVVDAIVDAGAFVMGRNMFGPVRGEWHNWQTEWTGWWGENPPYHGPVFVLTHYPRKPLEMEGGTTFHFVTNGIESAVEQARAASNGRNISIAGGPSTVQQALRAGLVDELRLHIAPVILGEGERLFEGVPRLELQQLSVASARLVTHVHYRVLR